MAKHLPGQNLNDLTKILNPIIKKRKSSLRKGKIEDMRDSIPNNPYKPS